MSDEKARPPPPEGKEAEERKKSVMHDPLLTPLIEGEPLKDIVEGGKEDSDQEGDNEEAGTVGHNGTNGSALSSKHRRLGTTEQPHMVGPRSRKISFADEPHIQYPLSEGGQEGIKEEMGNEIDGNDVCERLTKSEKSQDSNEERDKFPFMAAREARFSTASRTSRFSLISRPSFGGLMSSASMASLKSTLTKVNSELYPERGSFISHSLGQSFAKLPEPIAARIYIITQVLAAVSVSIGSMAVGFNAAYTSPALASMDAPNSTFVLTPDQKSWVGSLMPLSALVGSLLGGYLIDALGRKMLILLCGPPFFAAMIIIGSAANVWMLYVGRAMVGLCVGLLTLSLPVYLGETIQPEIRGTLGLLPTTIGNIGILFCFLIGTFVNWSWLAFIGALIPLLFFCLMIFVPETPRWYVSKGREDRAQMSLQWLRGTDNDVEFELEAIEENFQMSQTEASSCTDLFKSQYRKAILISVGLMLVQQLSGINAVIFYTVDIFEQSGSTIDGNLSTIIVGIVNFLSCFAANILIDKLGRKILLYISNVCMVLSLFSLASYFYMKHLAELELNVWNATVTSLSDETNVWNATVTAISDETNVWNATVASLSWLPLVSFMVYVVAFSLGWGPIPWLFMGEALPAKIRGTSASLVTAINWGCTFIVTKTFPGMVTQMGAHGVFFMFGIVMVIGFLFSIFFVPETKGKSLEEIEAELSGRKVRQRRYSEVSGIVIK